MNILAQLFNNVKDGKRGPSELYLDLTHGITMVTPPVAEDISHYLSETLFRLNCLLENINDKDSVLVVKSLKNKEAIRDNLSLAIPLHLFISEDKRYLLHPSDVVTFTVLDNVLTLTAYIRTLRINDNLPYMVNILGLIAMLQGNVMGIKNIDMRITFPLINTDEVSEEMVEAYENSMGAVRLSFTEKRDSIFEMDEENVYLSTVP